eukprot:Partr_v1_DN26823_c1_g1_i1_m40948 putative orotidine 5-phosphate decarboxylase
MSSSFGERARNYWSNGNRIGRDLLELMEEKRTNLSLSVDVTSCGELLRLADLIGPEICVLKTHVDILTDFTPDFTRKLVEVSRKHRFLIFEDRKFADIGNTVLHQYSGGMYRIADWAHITNAHSVPGEGIISGLQRGAVDRSSKSMEEGNLIGGDRALLMLAEMSSAGALATGEYTKNTIDMALRHRDFCIGFVAGRRLEGHEGVDFIYFSPGVQLESGVDSLGQQYRTPELVLGPKCMSDIVIVGRGICNAPDPLATARIYRERCWKAYEARLS